jgi:Nuclear protein 96
MVFRPTSGSQVPVLCCRYSQGGSTPIHAALDKFSGAVRHATAPAPAPLHTERHGGADGTGAAADVNLQLLRLYAGRTTPDSEADLAALLNPAGYSREPLDGRLAWMLHSVLRAIGVLPPGAEQRPQVQWTGSCLVVLIRPADHLPIVAA